MQRLLLVLIVLLTGCGQARLTEPSRTATEQFLISTAAAETADGVEIRALQDQAIYIDTSHLQDAGSDDQDRQYLVATVRAALLKGGARLTTARDDADIVVEMRSGGLSIDRYAFFVGVPASLFGPALSGAGGPAMGLTQKEVALLRRSRQLGFAGVSLIAYHRETGELVTFAGPAVDQSHVDRWRIFILGGRTFTDIPALEPPTE